MKKRVTKLLAATLIAAQVFCVLPAFAAAQPNYAPLTETVVLENGMVIRPMAEETIWYERYVNGQRQLRLWSLTYGKWLTDWMNA